MRPGWYDVNGPLRRAGRLNIGSVSRTRVCGSEVVKMNEQETAGGHAIERPGRWHTLEEGPARTNILAEEEI